MSTQRAGIVTFSGRWFDPANPDPNSFLIEDIAHALACVNRFGGHVSKPYSVAQHSYLCSIAAEVINPTLAYQALMHDAHEAYIGDMPSPLKRGLSDYCEMEHRVERALRAHFGLPAELDPVVKMVDGRMLTTEAKRFGLEWWNWYPEWPPYANLGTLEPWPWAKARQRFLDRFHQLRPRP